jgi:hypothetical protein
MLFKESIFKSEIHNRTNFILKTVENVVTGYFFRNNRSDSFHSPPSLAHSPPSLAHSPPSLARGRLCLNPSPGVELPPQLGLDQRGRCPPLLPRGLRR